MTNGEIIRKLLNGCNITDEELAKIRICPYNVSETCTFDMQCYDCRLTWLKKDCSEPTIDVNEKRARWVKNPSGSELYPFTCTSCKESADWKYKFCPNCGIQMDLRSLAEVQLDEADSVMMGD